MAAGDEISQTRLQVLGTVHQALQTARGTTIFESSGRATLFLTTVSSSLVALAFIGQATNLGATFYLFAYVLLAAMIFIGVVTFERLVQTGVEDMIWARGIGRILHFYVEQDPHLSAYLVQSAGDDKASVYEIYGGGSPLQILLTTASMVGVVTSAIFGVLAALIAVHEARLTQAVGLAAGLGLFAATAFAFVNYERGVWLRAEQRVPSRFPAASSKNGSQ